MILNEPERIVKAMSQTIINAKQFLEDSRVLAKNNSLGHATSLAILGFEEAHKAYLLIQLHPSMEDYIPSKHRKDVMKQLAQHLYKLKMGLAYQVFFQYLAYENGSASEREKIKETLLRVKELREKSKQFQDTPFEARQNATKNKGFYVDPFTSVGVWSPTNMLQEELDSAQSLLESHISLVQDVVEFYIALDFQIPEEVHDEMNILSRALNNSRGKGLASLKRELDRGGETGKEVRGFLEFLEEYYGVKGKMNPKYKRR
jgi:AbiV family abortive infection protein